MHNDGALSVCFFLFNRKITWPVRAGYARPLWGARGRKRPEYFAKLSDWAAYRL